MDSRFCFYCGNPLSRSQATKDHVLPRAKGGTDAKKNLVDSCRQCNEDKGALLLSDFRAVMAYRAGVNPSDFKFYGEEQMGSMFPEEPAVKKRTEVPKKQKKMVQLEIIMELEDSALSRKARKTEAQTG